MADVSKISGPTGPSESPGKKDKSVDADKFHQEMRKRVQEVSQVDPDEQKKRKRGEEAEEEEDLNPLQDGPSTPASQVTPFSLESEKKLTVKRTEDSSLPQRRARASPNAPSPAYPSPSTEESQEPSESAQTTSYQPSQQVPASPQRSNQTRWTPEGQQPVKPGPPEEKKHSAPSKQPPQAKAPQKKQTEPGIGAPVVPPVKAGPPPATDKGKPPVAAKKPLGVTGSELEQAPSIKTEDTSAFFEQMGAEQVKAQETGKKKKLPEDEQVGALQTLPSSQPHAEREIDIEEKKETIAPIESTGFPMATEGQGLLPSPLPRPETIPPYAHMHPQVQELFDRMVGVMTVMTMSGHTETVITLNSPQFASSVFFGTQIIIQEFSTAPHAFNIQLNGSPQAVALFQGNAEDLMAAFQAGNYNFRINRLETGYLKDRPVFRRKEKAGGDDNTGGNLS